MVETEPNRLSKILWVDLETSGINPRRHGIIEVGILVEVDGKVVEEQTLLMNPEPYEIIAKSLEIQGRTLDEVRGYPNQAEQFKLFMDLLGQHIDCYDRNDKFILAGYNVAAFDSLFLRNWFIRNGDKFYGSWFFPPTLDVYTWIAALIAAGLRLPNFQLSTVAFAFGIKYKAHNALEDIRATRELYRRIREGG